MDDVPKVFNLDDLSPSSPDPLQPRRVVDPKEGHTTLVDGAGHSRDGMIEIVPEELPPRYSLPTSGEALVRRAEVPDPAGSGIVMTDGGGKKLRGSTTLYSQNSVPVRKVAPFVEERVAGKRVRNLLQVMLKAVPATILVGIAGYIVSLFRSADLISEFMMHAFWVFLGILWILGAGMNVRHHYNIYYRKE